MTWVGLAQKKRDSLSSLIPNEWRIHLVPSAVECPNAWERVRAALTPEELEITELAPLSLLANIHAEVWSAEDVVRAFCHRAALVHQLTNCLAEIMFEEAITTARSLDQHYKQYGTLRGPLHGLPMSFMDRYRIAGYETASGFVAWLGAKDTTHSEGLIVRHMRRLGAVPFCKTSCPQSMLLAATDNNITGPTLNPFCRALSAGGAAGGEGALQAMRGSPCGWVTEVAGSARIPAAFNHVFALRVCQGRLSNTGITSANEGFADSAVTPALICWDLPMLQHISRLTLGSQVYQEDPYCLDLPWRESRWMRLQRSRPRFAIMHHDAHTYPQPPVQRALNLVHAVLKAHQYDVVDWTPPNHATAVETHFRLLGADGGSTVRRFIDKTGEPPVKGLQQWYGASGSGGKLSAEQLWSWSNQRVEYRKAYCKYWGQFSAADSPFSGIEGVIMPVLANAAAYEHGLSYFGKSPVAAPCLYAIIIFLTETGYSAIVNYLDYTAVSFPVTTVNESIDIRQFDRNMKNAKDAKVQVDCEQLLDHIPISVANVLR